MTTPSPELLAVSRRWFRAAVARQDRQLRNLLAESPALRFIGTAEGEHWQGMAVREAIGAHFHEVPEITNIEEVLGEAFEIGAMGWSCFVHRFTFGFRPEAPVTFRTTLIFALLDGSWKIVQRHASIPVSNTAILGHEHMAISALVEAAQIGFSLGQREGLASIMFTDVVSSSALAAAMGDRLWSRRIARHLADMRRIVEAHSGQFVKSLGDGTMASFTSARQALTAAAEMQTEVAAQDIEPLFRLRIGVHTGDVVQSDDDFFGTVVNKAARITAIAGPGEIRLSDATRLMVGDGDFTFSDTTSLRLQGLEGEHVVHRLDWRPAT